MGNVFFLTEAEDLEDAEFYVARYLDEKGIWNYSRKLPELSGPLAQKREILIDLYKNWDWKKRGEELLIQAEKYKAKGNFKMYGKYLYYASNIYCQELINDTPVFNIESEDYSIPEDTENWWVISINLFC